MPRPFSNSGYRQPATPDKRNFLLEKAQPIQPYPVTVNTDLSAFTPFYQAHLSDCVENAITFVKKFHEYRNTTVIPDLSRRSLVIPTVQMDGFPLSEGTSVQNALYVAHKRGIAEVQYLNDDHDVLEAEFVNPAAMTPSVLANALTHTVYSYAFLSSVTEQTLKNAINQNGVVLVGLKLDKNWWSTVKGAISWQAADLFTNGGHLRLPTDAASISGHAVVLSGYDARGFWGPNSFSTDWGDKGFLRIGLDYIPSIYEAAVLVDLLPTQIQALKDAQNNATQVDTVINNLDPKGINFQQILVDLMKVVGIILEELNLK